MCRSAWRPNVRSSPTSTATSSPMKSTCRRRSWRHGAAVVAADDGERAGTEVDRRAGLDHVRAARLERRHLPAGVGHDERAVGRAAVGDEDLPALEPDLEVAARHLVADQLDPPHALAGRVGVAVGVAADQQLLVELDDAAVVEGQATEARAGQVDDRRRARRQELAAHLARRRRRRVGVAVAALLGVDQRAPGVAARHRRR